MKPEAEAQERRDLQTERPTRRSDPTDPKPLFQLSDDQRRILDCLRTAGSGLTLRQLEIRAAGSAPILQAALDDLLEQGLVARLNTFIPSYAFRYPGIGVYAE